MIGKPWETAGSSRNMIYKWWISISKWYDSLEGNTQKKVMGSERLCLQSHICSSCASRQIIQLSGHGLTQLEQIWDWRHRPLSWMICLEVKPVVFQVTQQFTSRVTARRIRQVVSFECSGARRKTQGDAMCWRTGDKVFCRPQALAAMSGCSLQTKMVVKY